EASDWPGVTAAVEDIGARELSAERPPYYFVPKRWPPTASIALTMPPCLTDMPLDEAQALIRAELEHQEAQARAYVKEQGWKVRGAVAARNVSPYRCATSWRELGKLQPHIAAGRGQLEA